jgi:hypothetical protein
MSVRNRTRTSGHLSWKLTITGVSRSAIPAIEVTTSSPATVSPWPLIRLDRWANCSSVVCATDSRSRPASVGV